MDRQESLRLSGRLEPSHLPLARSCRLVRDLNSIVGVAFGVVDYGRHHISMRCTVAAQLVCHQPPGFASLTFQELAEEPLGRSPVAARLDENVDHVAVLVNGAPEILPLTLDRHEDFVQVPRVAEATLSPLELSSVLRTKLPTPLSDSLVGHEDTPLGKKVFDISKTQTESVVEPDRVADDLRREPISVVVRCFGIHPRSLPVSAST